MFVLAADSSMKTRRAGSSPPWLRRQRRRALATSGLFCSAAWSVFFYMCQTQPRQHPVDRPDGAVQLQALFDLRQRHVRFLRDQGLQCGSMDGLQPGFAPAIHAEEGSREEVAKRFKVSLRMVKKLLVQRNRTGDLRARCVVGRVDAFPQIQRH